jgi:hypothetical protein
MVLGGDSGVVDHGSGVGGKARHGAADVGVDLHDLFDGGGLEELGGHTLLDAEDDAMGGSDADGCWTELRVIRRKGNEKDEKGRARKEGSRWGGRRVWAPQTSVSRARR